MGAHRRDNLYTQRGPSQAKGSLSAARHTATGLADCVVIINGDAFMVFPFFPRGRRAFCFAARPHAKLAPQAARLRAARALSCCCALSGGHRDGRVFSNGLPGILRRKYTFFFVREEWRGFRCRAFPVGSSSEYQN